MKLWAAVDTDEYARIYAIADSAHQLADMLGIKLGTIYCNQSKVRKGQAKAKYITINIPDDDDEQDLIMAAVDHASDMNSNFVPEDEWLAAGAIDYLRKKDKKNGKR